MAPAVSVHAGFPRRKTRPQIGCEILDLALVQRIAERGHGHDFRRFASAGFGKDGRCFDTVQYDLQNVIRRIGMQVAVQRQRRQDGIAGMAGRACPVEDPFALGRQKGCGGLGRSLAAMAASLWAAATAGSVPPFRLAR